jgi:light-regulated signal transduction histidine kinase (bacteriophytochrome)
VVKKTKKRGTYEIEWTFSGKNGEQLVCEMIAFLLPQGTSCHIMFVIKDITDRKEQDQIIKENVVALNLKNAELTKYIESNNQLENFAAIASHDMQAPLRTIQSYTQLLQRSLKENATPAQNEYMHFITSSTSNMRHLIRDLRAFSKVDSAKLNIRSINIDFMLTEVVKELKATIDYQRAEVVIINNLPVVDGDRIKLKQLFQNLIANALKYVEKDVIPRVEISSEERDEDFLFKVKDNGIGIAEKNQERIFQLFERLHEISQYVGTGIGLSLCKKVVEQHFGKIGVESKEGEGSTFYFTISKGVSGKFKEIM